MTHKGPPNGFDVPVINDNDNDNDGKGTLKIFIPHLETQTMTLYDDTTRDVFQKLYCIKTVPKYL